MSHFVEHFVLKVQELSGQGKYQEISNMITTSPMGLMPSQISMNVLDNALETFNDYRHSLGVLHILTLKYNQFSPNDDFELLFRQTKSFLESCCKEQVKCAVDPFCDLCHRFTAAMVERGDRRRAVPLLLTAIDRLQSSPSDLTEIHGDLCQLCLLSKWFEPALRFLDVDITNVVRGKAKYAAKGFLLYFYYGGMIYTALKKYDKALFFFEAAITVESVVVSHIMLEAYKKHILLSLITKGKVEPLPKWTSSVVERFAHQISKVYHDLDSVYASNSVNHVRDFCANHAEQFARDGNTGLIKQCIASISRKNIKKLTKTFLTLSLSDVAQRCNLSSAREAERHLVNMIEDGEIYATINQRDGMVLFKDSPNKFDDPDCFLELEQKMRRYMDVADKVKKLSENIQVDPLFINKVGANEEEGAAGPGPGSVSNKLRSGSLERRTALNPPGRSADSDPLFQYLGSTTEWY
ncbi:COP9 signalosome complex subunit 3 [Galendromus occidentalis]|uniref:COP9 signalosome complex subunit 3 n=1 Tax=Galendromus occidentalis TaxID=34638 RepID=A0AAJ6QS35_9ACAR|nr:COP9 signalosome complex subunit 3 [Galendromus occidentalis]